MVLSNDHLSALAARLEDDSRLWPGLIMSQTVNSTPIYLSEQQNIITLVLYLLSSSLTAITDSEYLQADANHGFLFLHRHGMEVLTNCIAHISAFLHFKFMDCK